MRARGHTVVAFVRPGRAQALVADPALAGAIWREGEATDAASIARDGVCGERFDAWVSCLASRGGAPRDAWAVEHAAHRALLAALQAAGARRVVLLSAICVQKPRLAFQQAKLAFERELMASGTDWTLVRPTAFFKSLSGQVARVRAGKPFLVFGDGTLTACKPIADADLAAFLADTLADPATVHRVLPIGGPGPAITPRDQAALLAELLGRPVPLRSVSPRLLDAIAGTLGALARLLPLPALVAKAEFARIGRYYATESMLVWDERAGRYDAAATPSTGRHTLREHYARLLAGEAEAGLGEHAVF